MNSVVLNIADEELAQRLIYSIEKAGYRITEDQQNNDLRIIAFSKP